MGRPREFDAQEVLDRVVDVFWRLGYEGATTEVLVAASGVNRASLYNAFGGKKNLFLQALDRYADQVAVRRNELLALDSPREAVRSVFDALIGRFKNDKFPLGCLLTNSAVDAPVNSSDIGRKISAKIGEMEVIFYEALLRAKAGGQLKRDVDPRAGARFIVSTLRGMAVMHRINCDPGYASDTADLAMKSLFAAET